MRLFFLVTIAALATLMVPMAKAQVDDGFIVIPRDAWRRTDDGRMEACTASKEGIGLLSNTYTCAQWSPLQAWLKQRTKTSVTPVLTRWDYQCRFRSHGPSNNTDATWRQCEEILVLYYRLGNKTAK